MQISLILKLKALLHVIYLGINKVSTYRKFSQNVFFCQVYLVGGFEFSDGAAKERNGWICDRLT